MLKATDRVSLTALLVLCVIGVGCDDSNRGGSPAAPSPVSLSPAVGPAVSTLNPDVTTITPNIGGTTGATLIRILGSDLQESTALSFGGVSATRFGYSPDGAVVYATTPPSGRGAVDVVITNRRGQVTRVPAAFTYGDPTPLTVTEIAPGSGTVAGGTYVTIRGAGFQDGARVMVGGIDAHLFFQTLDGGIAISAPPHAQQAVDVVVANPDGQRVTVVGGYKYVPSHFSDFNGDWDGYIGDEGETPLTFSIRNDVFVSLTCGRVNLTNVPALPADGGEWQIPGAGASRMTGALVRADYAEGMTNIAECSSYDAGWFAKRR